MVKYFMQEYINSTEHLMNLTLEITTACNLKCCHCYIGNRRRTIETHQIYESAVLRVVDEAYHLGAVTITITGGEPMTHPRFLSIIKAIKEKGFIVFLKTNGTLINSDNIQYIQKYVDNVTLSRYGCCSDTYDTVTGVSKSYEKYCSAIDLLKKYKIPFKENAILLKENERELESFMQSGCKVEKYISSNVDYPYAEKHRPSDAALFKYYTNYIKNEHFKPSSLFDESTINRPICSCGTRSLVVTASGNIVPCTNFNYILGSIYEDDLESIWKSHQLKALRECLYTYEFKMCSKCPKSAYLLSMAPCNNYFETGLINNVSKEMCRHCRIVEAAYHEYTVKCM